jgi:hypothetical protein
MTKTSKGPARGNCRVNDQGDAAEPTIGARIGGRRQERPVHWPAQARPRPGQIPPWTFLPTESEEAALLENRRGLGTLLTTRGSWRRRRRRRTRTSQLLLCGVRRRGRRSGMGEVEGGERNGKGLGCGVGTPPSRLRATYRPRLPR